MKRLSVGLLALGISFGLWPAELAAQREPDPRTGDPVYTRWGVMDGNLVRTLFSNNGQIARWPDQPSGEWPKGTGHSYVDGVALVVQARTTDNDGHVIYPMSTNYREFVDVSPEGEVWGWGPLPGYFDRKSEEPAMSDEPRSWPREWPDRPPDWAGFWNGFFGKGVFNADLEAYVVYDDDPDEEWNFYPDPSDTTRRGLGLEVAERLFQWNQVLAEDAIFAVYFITNEGQTDYDSTYYNFYIDWGIGGTDDSSDDAGGYNTVLDIAFAYDFDGFGSPGDWSPVGQGAMAFLESPGISSDFLDNDEDGFADESRDSGPGQRIDGQESILSYINNNYNVEKLQEFFDLNVEDFPAVREGVLWTGDEDLDWRSFSDINENGQWDPGEPINDDVGADGISPVNPDYVGPDLGEADGVPTAGEPNFDFLDKDESDQIGLTGFNVFPVHFYELHNEKQNWGVFTQSVPPGRGQDQSVIGANLGMFFSSGPFPLRAGQTENYSMALFFGEDEDDLFRSKKTIQQIFNADYRFARPPDRPKLTAIPGDRRVTLIWDKQAERSFDPFLQEFDFEGYRIYRSTEPEFLEVRLITDAFGRLTFRKPIAQFDLKNGIQGLHPIDVNGVKFNLGEDTGLRHTFIDSGLTNGQTYYYAVVSYDRGLVTTSITGEVEGIPPSESPSVIKKDVAGNITLDINTAVVTPNAPAAGYVGPGLTDAVQHEGPGTGELDVRFIIPDSVKNGRTYEVTFRDTARFHNEGTITYSIRDVTGGQPRLLAEALPLIGRETETPLFDGLSLNIINDTQVDLDRSKTGWVVGASNYLVDVSLNPALERFNIRLPADFEIEFSDQVIDQSDRALGFPSVPTKFTIRNLTEDTRAKFLFRDFVKDSTLTPDTTESIILFVDNPDSRFKVSTTWRIIFETNPDADQVIPPMDGDMYRMSFTKPFRTGDVFRFTVQGTGFSEEQAQSDLDRIAVVPNPYVAAVSWEPKSLFRFGRGERRIYFINLPPKCTIRIYTVRGYLVDTIEHDTAISNGAEPWDLVSKDGMNIAYGVYVYHVEAPGIGEKMGKFAVIK